MDSTINEKCLVVGSSGQLGSRLSDHFEHLGWDVTKLARKSSTESNTEFWDRLSRVQTNFQLVVNAASPSHTWAAENPSEFMRWMDLHSRTLASLSDRFHSSRLFSLSTTRVYGLQPRGLITEEGSVNPDSVYADGHLRAESALLESNWSVLRLSNLFGQPGIHGKLSEQLLTNLTLIGFASGKETTLRGPRNTSKDFLPISAFLLAIEELAVSDFSGTLNIASGNSRTIGDWVEYLATAFEHMTSIRPRFRFEVNSSTAASFEISNAKLKRIIHHWEPDFDSEIFSLISYIRKMGYAA